MIDAKKKRHRFVGYPLLIGPSSKPDENIAPLTVNSFNIVFTLDRTELLRKRGRFHMATACARAAQVHYLLKVYVCCCLVVCRCSSLHFLILENNDEEGDVLFQTEENETERELGLCSGRSVRSEVFFLGGGEGMVGNEKRCSAMRFGTRR